MPPEEIEDLQKELIRVRAALAESEDARVRLTGWMERCTDKLNQYGRLSAKDNYAQDVIRALNDLDIAREEIERLKGAK